MFKNRESFEVLKIRNYRLFAGGRFLLTLAIQMQMTTIGLQVYYEHTKSEFMLGMIGLTEAIPFIICSFYSGILADRFDRKKIIITSIIALLLGSLALFLFTFDTFKFIHSYGVIPLFSLVFVFGIVRAFLAASQNPFMSQLVERKHYTSSATWNSTVWHLSAIIGPVLAAAIYGFNNTLNAKFTYGINILLFLISFLMFLRIKNYSSFEVGKKEKLLKSIKEGLSFVFSHKILLSAISLDLFAVLFGGAVAILPAFNDKILHAGPEAFGLLRTAPAIGAVAMAFLLSFFPPGKKAGRLLLMSVVAFGVFTIGFAFSTNYWLAFVMLFLTGAFDNISVVIRHTILQLMTPENMRGRVSAVNSIFIGSSNEIGAFESGITAKWLGLVRSVALGGILTLAVVFSIDRLNPGLKKLNLKDHE